MAVLVAMAAIAPSLHAQTAINFDDLPTMLGGGASIGSGYGGLNWGVGNTIGWMSEGNAFYTDIACRSGRNCAYNGFGNIAGLTSSTPITLSGWIRRWNWTDNTGGATSVLIEALNAGGAVVGSQTVSLTGSYQSFLISTLFTTLRFTTSGGTGLQCAGANCGYFLLDDITVNPVNQNVVPEPGTYALMATGLVGLFGVRRFRSRKQA